MDSDGREPRVLCTEPWRSYYILRRGILPCCYGWKPIAPMSEWRTAWNSPALQEIRACLAKGELSEYCRLSLTCPIVQRHMAEARRNAVVPALAPGARPPLLRFINRLFGGLPAKIYGKLGGRR